MMKIGVIDIGSNSIRLVIYGVSDTGGSTTGLGGTGVLPEAHFNERVVCGLGAGVVETGMLAAGRIAHALQILERFALILAHSSPDRLVVFATEAVRHAQNKDDFLTPAEAILGTNIRILSGAEEAHYAAIGVMAGFPQIEGGVVADLGGGSLEIQSLDLHPADDGVIEKGGATSLPFGHLNPWAKAEITQSLERLAWLSAAKGRVLYAVGGAWRSIASAHIRQSKKHLKTVHGLVLSPPELKKIMKLIDKADGAVDGIARARRPSMRQAILVLRCLLRVVKPKAVVFSTHGVREGILYEKLHQAPTPDNAGEAQARLSPHFSPHFSPQLSPHLLHGYEGLSRAMVRAAAPFFAPLPEAQKPYAVACAMLCDIAWRDAPDYRGLLALQKILGLSAASISHSDRIWMAAALFVRYQGVLPKSAIFRNTMTKQGRKTALYTGWVLRILMGISAGLPELLALLSISRDGKAITVTPSHKSLISPKYRRKLAALNDYTIAKIVVKE